MGAQGKLHGLKLPTFFVYKQFIQFIVLKFTAKCTETSKAFLG